MSADNSVVRAGRDTETPAEQAGFQIPPELARQYQVRVIEPADGSDRRVGMFLPTDRDTPSIEIGGNGDRIIAKNEDPETVAALVKIAKHNGWEGIDVDGSPAFRRAVWGAASREGLTVRGYDPDFGEQARMETLRSAYAERQRSATIETLAPASVPGAPKPTVEIFDATIPVRATDATPDKGVRVPSVVAGGAELSEGDRRLLVALSAYTQDRNALSASLNADADPVERQFQSERLEANRDALGGALDRALESPTLVSAFSKSGYEPDDLRSMGREGAWDGAVADAIVLVRSGLNRHDLTKEPGARAADADALVAQLEERLVAESTRSPEQKAEPEPQDFRAERQREAAAERRQESEDLAELFLHAGAERVANEPQLANALAAQATMDQHLAEVFDGDASRIAAASLESRQMISDVLRRGLDVSVREPTPVREIEPPQHTPDLER